MNDRLPADRPAARLPADRPAARFPALDGLRAVGALAVLTTHVGFQSGDALRGPFAGVLARLDAGVAIFFVISGFLLFRPYAVAHLAGSRTPAVRSYLWHRAVRILPVLWLAVAAAWALVPSARADAWDYLRNATLVQVYTEGGTLEGLTQMWSLATEAAFYLALPLLGWLLCRGRRGASWTRRVMAVCALLGVLGPVWMATCTALDAPLGRLWLPGFLGWFGAGMALATWNAGRSAGVIAASPLEVVARRPGTVWGVAIALYVLVSTPIAGPLDLSAPSIASSATKNLLYGVLGLLVVAPAVVPGAASSPRLRALSGRVCHVLGSISYGVFAYHVVVLALVERTLGLEPFAGSFAPRFALTLVVSLALAAASFYGLERPLMRRARRREHRSTFILEPSPAGSPGPVDAPRPAPAAPDRSPAAPRRG
ncbi:acyltransferase family protein [Pedococcus soli]